MENMNSGLGHSISLSNFWHIKQMRLEQKCLRFRQTIHLRDVLYAAAYIKKTEIITLMNMFAIYVDIVQMMTGLGQ